MSISTDQMESMGLETEAASYADHEHINLAFNLSLPTGQQTDDTLALDPLADELDSNEVAELVYYSREVSNPAGQFEFGLGINVSEGDFVEQAGANNPTAFDISEDTGFSGGGAIYEEAGVLDYFEAPTKRGGVEGTLGLREIPFKELYNHGPFIDSTDDLDVHLEANNDTGADQNVGVKAQLVYETHEVAQGIPEFADPRRLMD